jgi:hypothetical protein
MLAATQASADPLRKAACFAVLLHHVQADQFQRVMALRGWPLSHAIHHRNVVTWPASAAHMANSALGLDLTFKEISGSVEANARRHAKAPAHEFGVHILRSFEKETEGRFGEEIEFALEWARGHLPALQLTTDLFEEERPVAVA